MRIRPMRFGMRLRRCVMLLVLGEVAGEGGEVGFVLSLVVVGIVIG